MPLGYVVWRVAKFPVDEEERELAASCLPACADEVLAEIPDLIINNESSNDDSDSRSHSRGSHQSQGSAVKPQAA